MSTLRTALTEPDRPKDLQVRFVTLGGSYVTGPGHDYPSGAHHWSCRGCNETSTRPERDFFFIMRQAANDHAAACRAIPLT